MKMFWVFAAVITLAITGCGTSESSGGDAKTDSGFDAGDPNCHYDCFYHAECKDGLLTEYVHAPVPCEYWTGSCPTQTGKYKCAEGCRDDLKVIYDRWEDPRTLCREWLDCRYNFSDAGQDTDRGQPVRDCGYEVPDGGQYDWDFGPSWDS